jgi:hypothetical protein
MFTDLLSPQDNCNPTTTTKPLKDWKHPWQWTATTKPVKCINKKHSKVEFSPILPQILYFVFGFGKSCEICVC